MGVEDKIAGETFRWFRRDRGWTQRELAHRLRSVAEGLMMDATGISKLETGRRGFTWAMMHSFFVALEIDLQAFARRYALVEAERKGMPVLVGEEVEQAVEKRTQEALTRLLHQDRSSR